MKVLSDFSMLVKLVIVSLLVGIAVGLCSAGALLGAGSHHPDPGPSTTMTSTSEL